MTRPIRRPINIDPDPDRIGDPELETVPSPEGREQPERWRYKATSTGPDLVPLHDAVGWPDDGEELVPASALTQLERERREAVASRNHWKQAATENLNQLRSAEHLLATYRETLTRLVGALSEEREAERDLQHYPNKARQQIWTGAYNRTDEAADIARSALESVPSTEARSGDGEVDDPNDWPDP